MSGELMSRAPEARTPEKLNDFVTVKRLMRTEIAMMQELRGVYEQIEQLTKVVEALVGGGADGMVQAEGTAGLADVLSGTGGDVGSGEREASVGAAGDPDEPRSGG